MPVLGARLNVDPQKEKEAREKVDEIFHHFNQNLNALSNIADFVNGNKFVEIVEYINNSNKIANILSQKTSFISGFTELTKGINFDNYFLPNLTNISPEALETKEDKILKELRLINKSFYNNDKNKADNLSKIKPFWNTDLKKKLINVTLPDGTFDTFQRGRFGGVNILLEFFDCDIPRAKLREEINKYNQQGNNLKIIMSKWIFELKRDHKKFFEYFNITHNKKLGTYRLSFKTS